MWHSCGILGKMQKHTDQSECNKQYFGTKVTYSSKGKEVDLQTLEVSTQSIVLGEVYRQTIETCISNNSFSPICIKIICTFKMHTKIKVN